MTLVSVLSGLGTTPVLGEHDGHLTGIDVPLAPWARPRVPCARFAPWSCAA
ncbi:hypothetical protein [Streptomyces sp. NPDC058268]|uniref:hypothetical protein n=1 Tax=Streptomyces sp. NPDC058268 TaxID=3346413 RepID=UPI0036E73491